MCWWPWRLRIIPVLVVLVTHVPVVSLEVTYRSSTRRSSEVVPMTHVPVVSLEVAYRSSSRRSSEVVSVVSLHVVPLVICER